MGLAFLSGSRAVGFRDGKQASPCCSSERLVGRMLEGEAGREGWEFESSLADLRQLSCLATC